MSVDLQAHFDWVAQRDARARRVQSGFHRQIQGILRHRIPAGCSVLEVGCARGDVLADLRPSRGVGVDLSPVMLEQARALHPEPHLEFRHADIQRTPIEGTFDYIVADFLTGYLSDIQAAFENLRNNAHPRTRLVLTSLKTAWKPTLSFAQRMRMAAKQPQSNWLTAEDQVNLLELSGWELVHSSSEILFPFHVPGLTALFNRFCARMPVVQWLASAWVIVARPKAAPRLSEPLSCSVVVPARNEAGNIKAALDRVPNMGRGTELIFVEGNSADDTWETIQREVAAYAGSLKVRALRQPGKGKWDAVRAGFAEASGEILVIQDGDLTAPPEDLPKFYNAIVRGDAEFANGCRLIYPMESGAMRLLNLIGNKFFAVALTFVLRQPVKDSLCGTKMLLRKDYERLLVRISEFGDFDPFGDFNLLFGSALLGLRIRDVPIRYRERTYGTTNISRFKHGWILMKMAWFGLWHLRCFPIRISKKPKPDLSGSNDSTE